MLEPSLLALLPPELQEPVRLAAIMESREQRRAISPDAMVIVMVRACLAFQTWTERERQLTPTPVEASVPVRLPADPVPDRTPYPPEWRVEAIADSILAVLRQPATIAEIETLVNARRYVPVLRESLGAVLTQLAKKGEIRRVAIGVYQQA